MRTIKRYANRKLYDTETSSYVTLEHVAELIRDGEDVRVIDNKSGNDISRETMAQIILRMEKGETESGRINALRDLIVRGTESVREAIIKSVSAGKAKVNQVEDIVDNFLKRLTDRGVVTPDEAKKLMGSLVDHANKQAERIETMLDEHITATLVKLNIPTTDELDEMKKSLEALAEKVDQVTKARRAPERTTEPNKDSEKNE